MVLSKRNENENENENENVRGPKSGAEIEVNEEVDLDVERITKELTSMPNWSAKIRYLHSEGFRNSSISNILSELRGYHLSPQHVNNVLKRPLKGPGRSNPRIVDPREQQIVRMLPKPVLIKRSDIKPQKK